MHATLPMYDFPDVRDATDRWWRCLSRALEATGIDGVPSVLDRDAPHHHDAWARPGLLLSQSCGYPAMTAFRDRLTIVAAPVYAAPGCDGMLYSSVLLVPVAAGTETVADLRGGRCAVNAFDSQSGFNALRRVVAPLADGRAFFSEVVETGGHEASIAAVADGLADLCAVDCVTHAMLSRYRPGRLEGVRSIGFTPRAPGLPFVTAADRDTAEVAAIRSALRAAFSDPGSAADRAALLLDGVEMCDSADYEPVLDMEREAIALGCRALA